MSFGTPRWVHGLRHPLDGRRSSKDADLDYDLGGAAAIGIGDDGILTGLCWSPYWLLGHNLGIAVALADVAMRAQRQRDERCVVLLIQARAAVTFTRFNCAARDRRRWALLEMAIDKEVTDAAAIHGET